MKYSLVGPGALGAVLSVSVAALLAAPAQADEIFLKNGDRITGKIVSKADRALVVNPDFASSTRLSIPLDSVSTFSTSEPLVLELKDGTVLDQVATSQAEAGQVALEETATARSLPIAEIAKINPEGPRWEGSVGVNGLYSRSNSTLGQVGFKLDATRRTDTDRISLQAAYGYGRQEVNGVTTTSAENWRLLSKYDDFLSPTFYAFGSLTAESDMVNALRLRVTPSVGAGYQWVDRDDLHIRTEGGGSWLYEDYKFQPQALRKTALRLAYSADKTIDDGRVKLTHRFEYLPSTANWNDFLINADAGMRVALMGSMYSEVNAKLAYDNVPGLAARRTATELRLGVGLTY